MKRLIVVCSAICLGLSASAALARGGHGGGMSHGSSMSGMSATGGASGERVGAPGTNSLGTALSSSGFGSSSVKGPLLGTSPAVDHEEARVVRALTSVCRGC
jgi:hypothetical protein